MIKIVRRINSENVTKQIQKIFSTFFLKKLYIPLNSSIHPLPEGSGFIE